MKKTYHSLILFCGLSLANIGFSANGMLDYFQAVMSSKTMQDTVQKQLVDGWQLNDIKHSRTYRCPGCFGFDVYFTRYDQASGEMQSRGYKFSTRLDFETGKIHVGTEAQ